MVCEHDSARLEVYSTPNVIRGYEPENNTYDSCLRDTCAGQRRSSRGKPATHQSADNLSSLIVITSGVSSYQVRS
jgi:hypothetical protein